MDSNNFNGGNPWGSGSGDAWNSGRNTADAWKNGPVIDQNPQVSGVQQGFCIQQGFGSQRDPGTQQSFVTQQDGPGYGSWGDPVPKKKHTGLIVGIIIAGVVLAALIAAAVIILVHHGSHTPDAEPASYIDTTEPEGDAEAAPADDAEPAAAEETEETPAEEAAAPAEEAEEASAAEEPAMPEGDGVRAEFTHDYGSTESGTVTGYDADGNEVWQYTTDTYEAMQLDQVGGLGEEDGLYYLYEGNAVTALYITDGSVAWQAEDCVGSVTDICFDDDHIYLTSYYGPDLTILSRDGEVLADVDELDSDLYWAYAISVDGGMITIDYEGGGSDFSGGSLTVAAADYIG